MSRKKIYFLINSLQSGGAERVVSNLARDFSQKYDVTVITLKNDKFFELPDSVKYLPLADTRSNIMMGILIPWYILKLYFLLPKFTSGVSFLEISNFLHILVKKDAIISFRIHIDFFR